MHMSIKNKLQNFLRLTGLTNLKTRLIATYVLNIFDLVATAIFINWFGLDVEANPFAKLLFSNDAVYIFKTLMVAAGLLILYKLIPKHPKYNWVTWIVFTVYFALALYHCFLFIYLGVIFLPVILQTI